MRRTGLSRAAFIAAPLCAAILSALCAISCAAPLRIEASVDPLALLDPDDLVYARLSGSAALEVASEMLPPAELKQLRPMLERTRTLAIGLRALPSTEEASKGESRLPAFQAALIGDYPFRAASLSLGTKKGWERGKSAFYNARLGLHVAMPGPSLVLVSTESPDPLIARAAAGGTSPLPERFSGFASRELVVWAPEPFKALAARILGEEMELPVRGLFIATSPNASVKGGYEGFVAFLMTDERSARIFKPALRLAWYGLAGYLLGDASGEAMSRPLVQEGDLCLVSGLPLSPSRIAAALKRLER